MGSHKIGWLEKSNVCSATPGQHVFLKGLSSRSDLNGLEASVLFRKSDDAGRVTVQLVGKNSCRSQYYRVHPNHLLPAKGSAKNDTGVVLSPMSNVSSVAPETKSRLPSSCPQLPVI